MNDSNIVAMGTEMGGWGGKQGLCSTRSLCLDAMRQSILSYLILTQPEL